MQLTATQCQHAKPKAKPYKLNDGDGLYLEVSPKGTKFWRFQYYFENKRPRISIGRYPDVSLSDARLKRLEFRKLLASGIDPSQEKRKQALARKGDLENTFEKITREWHKLKYDSWTPAYGKYVLSRLENDIFPVIGSLPVRDIQPVDVLRAIRKMEARGVREQAHRNLRNISRVFGYAIVTGRAQNDPTYRLGEALKTVPRPKHYAALKIDELPAFLKVLRSNKARLYPQTIAGVELLMLTFVRTSELIGATWDEIDFEEAQWIIPAERMKMNTDHIVPLSRQSLSFLEVLKREALGRPHVFSHFCKPTEHMSNNTIRKAIVAMGYGGRMTGHGFRALAMTTIKEKLCYRHEVIDRQLAHQPRSKVDRAYDRAQFLDERRVMMQEWADYIDSLMGS